MLKTMCIFGTRPETIKMAPLVTQLNQNLLFDNKVCVTGQHQEMLRPFLDLFEIVPDYNLNVMTTNQDLSHLTAKILSGLSEIFKFYIPDIVFVHGDTTTAFAATLSAYYHKIPVAHVEAGLRTGDINLPWPEEANRKLSDTLSNWLFAPTQLSKENLLKEGIDENKITVTGNTVVDALFMTIKKLEHPDIANNLKKQFYFLNEERQVILITGHRRESFGSGFERICKAIAKIAKQHPNIDIVYPVHLNPNIQKPVRQLLGGIHNIYLIDPIDYVSFVYLMKLSYLILTDSGGIQEEAPSLGIPVLVMRDKTERPEGILSGNVKLVGTEIPNIVDHVNELLMNDLAYEKMKHAQNPYGDGHSASKIIAKLTEFYGRTINVKTEIIE